MVTVTTRAAKGSRLTSAEVDANFRGLASVLGSLEAVADFGAVGDGVADDGPAFLAWIAAVNASTGSVTAMIPAGTYDLTDITAALPITANNVTIIGAGSASTIIKIGATHNLFDKATGAAQTEGLTFVGFTVKGLGAATGSSAPDFGTINKVSKVRLHDVVMKEMGGLMSAFRNCDRIIVSDCAFERGGRGGLNIAECAESLITNSRFWKLGDDMISLHERLTSFVSGNHSIVNCSGYMCQGIKGVGGRNIAVTGCNFEFMAGYALSVESNASGSSEGANAGMNVTFTGNVIKDTVNNAYTTAHNSANRIIRLGGISANGSGLDDVPGYPDNSGVMVRPEPYYPNYDDDGTTAIPPSINYVISGNTVIQSLRDATNFSDLGYGDFFGYGGVEVDPAVNRATLMNVDFMLLEGYLNNVVVANNVITGMDTVFQIAAGANASPRLRNVLITGNVIQDVTQFIFDTQSSLTTDPDGLDIEFTRNRVDLDPYLANSNRVSTGAWTSQAANTPGLFIGARGNYCSQIRVFGNSFKNITAITAVTNHDNVYLCNPATIGTLNASNLGIGVVPFGNRVILIDSDPASATYGALVNAMVDSATAMPATGKYVTGHFVRNSAPAVAGGGGSKYVIEGWLRLTVGTGHVADTDWAEQRKLTGT